MFSGPIGLLVLLGVLAVAASLMNRARSSSAKRGEHQRTGDHSSSLDSSLEDHHPHSVRDQEGQLHANDKDGSEGGWDSDGSSNDSADPGGSDSPSSDD